MFKEFISKKNKLIICILILLLVQGLHINHIYNQTIKEVEKKNRELLNIQQQKNTSKEPTLFIQEKLEYYVVISEFLNIRKSNSINSERVGILSKGDIVEIISKNDGEWYKNKNNNYINKNYLKKIDSNSSLQEYINKRKLSSRGLIRKPINIVNSKSNLHINDLKTLLSGTKLEGIEEAILKAERDYNINSFFILAVARLESGNGTSQIAREKNNLFGLNAIDKDPYNKAYNYNTKSESVDSFTNIIKKYYVNKGLNTIEQINTIYSSSDKWSNKINNIMLSDYQEVKKLD